MWKATWSGSSQVPSLSHSHKMPNTHTLCITHIQRHESTYACAHITHTHKGTNDLYHVSACTRTTHTYVYACMHAHILAVTYVHAHTHTHRHTCSQTHTPLPPSTPSSYLAAALSSPRLCLAVLVMPRLPSLLVASTTHSLPTLNRLTPF